MAKKGRPFVYQSEEEKPVTVSLRLPRDLYDRVERYVKMHPGMTLTEFLLDGAQLRLDTPADPRDIILSDDNTVIQEVQEMVRAAVQAEIGKLSDFMGSGFGALKPAPAPEAPAAPAPDFSYGCNTVLQEIGEPKQGASPMPASQPETPVSVVQTALELSEDIVKIAEARRQYDKLGERPFAQLIFDRGIYRHRAKDGREVPIPHTTLREWLQRARKAGLL